MKRMSSQQVGQLLLRQSSSTKGLMPSKSSLIHWNPDSDNLVFPQNLWIQKLNSLAIMFFVRKENQSLLRNAKS